MPSKKTVRQDLGEILTEEFNRDVVREIVSRIKNMTSTQLGKGRCPECGSMRQVEVTMPDLKGQLTALIALMEQAEGKPGTQTGEPGGVTLIIERTWPEAQDSNELRSETNPEPGSLSPVAG